MGLIHLDAGVLIGLLDGDDAHHAAATSAVSTATNNGDRLAMAGSALAECLVGPARRGGSAVEIVRVALDRIPVAIVDLTPVIAETAAFLRARHRSLRLPDALVIATADVDRADRLITTDRRWPSAADIGTAVTIEVI